MRTKCLPMPIEEIEAKLADYWHGTLDNVYTLDQFLYDMNETMLAENGMGLAANQIDWAFRIFILKNDTDYTEFINPEIISQEELVTFEDEGCLSIPGVTANTKRYRKVKLKWLNREGIIFTGEFTDLQAFAVQHEIDHLDGKLYIDTLGPVKRSMVLKKHKKFIHERGK